MKKFIGLTLIILGIGGGIAAMTPGGGDQELIMGIVFASAGLWMVWKTERTVIIERKK